MVVSYTLGEAVLKTTSMSPACGAPESFAMQCGQVKDNAAELAGVRGRNGGQGKSRVVSDGGSNFW